MAFATETFGNINSRSGYSSRRKKSLGISTGTVITGVAVAMFAWVAATLITTQSMVLSLPRSDISSADLLTPRASAFIVPQGRILHPARLASQTVPMGGRIRASGTSPDADKREAIARSKTILARALVKQQLASALSQQASDLARAQTASAVAKNDAQSNISGTAVSITTPANSIPQPAEIAVSKPATQATGPNTAAMDHPGKDSLPVPASASDATPIEMASAAPPAGTIDRAVAESLATAASIDPASQQPFDIIPMPRPGQTPAMDSAASPDAETIALAEAEDASSAEELPTVVPLPRPAHVVARAAGSDSASTPDAADTSPAPVLAYAKPDEEVKRSRQFLNPFAALSPRGGTAIYDISAGTVYLPSGERLEAHSGLGYMRDNPRYVDRKNTGPTPPETYNLTYRESLFHGVQALRLTPANGARVYGRDGLLAHTYMLRGGRAESNGCVVFKDYRRFLAAFKRGEIKRIQVVARLSSAPSNSNVASR
ncbi:tlde1 domain-containing protein [Rhizobium mayense]|uniref:DUF2778 domain-containing protein n=1 Tax=Rhizobium mayense TaxID=1312184 RepID=A0ABT7JU22_9HYPH|nr:tlde1 domain-containing protein [Rhizobium mayense]MDL2399838.1 DUF2778 domain-containing protein [Rhizobium mayense]